MSFIHTEYVGHFDPSDPVRWKPLRPKPAKVLDEQMVKEMVESTGHAIECLLYMQEGYLACEWTRDPSISEEVWSSFLRRLADRAGAMLMDQHGVIYYPPDAKTAFEQALRQRRDSRGFEKKDK